MKAHNEVVHDFQWKLASRYALKNSLHYLAVWGFVWGTIVMVLRASMGISSPEILWGFSAVFFIVALAIFVAVQNLPSRESILALVDRQNQCGGLLMAMENKNVGEWKVATDNLNVPSVRWQSGSSWSIFLVSMVFLGVCFAVPQRVIAMDAHNHLNIDEEVRQMQERIEKLQKEKVIDDIKAKQIEKQMGMLKQEAQANDPVKTWEALDHIQKNIEQTIAESTEQAIKENEQLTKAEALTRSLAENFSELSPELLSKSLEELSSMMEDAQKESKLLKKRLAKKQELHKAIEGLKKGNLSKEEMNQLLDQLLANKKELDRLMRNLEGSNMISPEMLKQFQQAGQCNNKGLTGFLKKKAGEVAIRQLVNQWYQCNGGKCGTPGQGMMPGGMPGQGMMPGQGGITRGGGPAPMVLGNKTSQAGANFKAKKLPKSEFADLKNSQMVDISLGKPNDKESKIETSESGALTSDSSQGNSAAQQVILPKHETAVGRYFQRGRK